MTNILSGNMAGVFSGFLSYLSWMEISDQQENNINVQLHARNKTHYSGNTYSNYRWFNSKECNNFEDILNKNILFDLFEKNEYLTENYHNDCIYTECYPIDIKDIIKSYPTSLKYEGRGQDKDQYTDIDGIQIVRDALNKQWNKFKFTKSFHDEIEKEEKLIKGKKIICLMLRQSEHYFGYKCGEREVLDKAIETVKSKIDDYDCLLLTTQIQPFVDEFVKVFGDKCIYTERKRFPQDMDWKGGRYAHTIMTDEEYEREYKDAILDVILSSKSDFIIAGSSNMFLASLCMNPKVPFNIFLNTNGR